MSHIRTLQAREILDSRGQPTLEVDVILESGAGGRASVPAGASTGAYEAAEKRDKNPKRYGGKGVLQAIQGIYQEILPALKGISAQNQALIDARLIDLDGTPSKSRLGANALLAVSLACAKAFAAEIGLPLHQVVGGIMPPKLPLPLINILNGGLHADNQLDIQEFMIAPIGASSFSEALEMCAAVFQTLKKMLQEKGHTTSVGDEGGFAPKLRSTQEALDFIMEAILHAGYHPGEDISLALDVAASTFYHEGIYHLPGEGKKGDAAFLIHFYRNLAEHYPLISIEDGLAEDDWEGWKYLTQTLGKHLQLVGDDLFVTHPHRLKRGIEGKIANAILIKPNQIGTLTETLETIDLAHRNGYQTIMSHRSGETEDTTISDLAVGCGCAQIKAGSLSRSERLAKYNQLLRIAGQLGEKNSFWGREAFAF